jgi:hypothetical protein
MKELLLDTDDEPREELDEWVSGFAGDEPCEKKAAPIATTAIVTATRTRETLRAARAVLLWPTSNLIATRMDSSASVLL